MNGYSKEIIITVLVLLAQGCASSAVPVDFDGKPIVESRFENPVEDLKSGLKEEIYLDMAELELYRNGDTLICDQPEFISCISSTKNECVAESRGYVHSCVLHSKSALGKVDGKVGARQLVRHFTQCIFDKHLEKRDKEKIENCLNSTVQP